jgi:mono/diheme cytochrome c family protein
LPRPPFEGQYALPARPAAAGRRPVRLAAVTQVGRGPAAEPDKAPAFAPDQVAFYEQQVRPILKAHCLKCHGDDPKKVKGGLNLTSRKALLAGGDTGPGVDLAKPDESVLLKAVHYKDGLEMPPAGKLPADSSRC